ncbi:MAG: fibronectin type III domain-containing protein [Flavobacteriales bacterium]|nr:fibronectin type III domain-containing protein [Flavobacteriales bacterium]
MKHALLLLSLIATQAQAQIIYTDVDPDSTYTASSDTCSLDVDNDGNIDFLIVQRTVNAPCPGGPANCATTNTRPRSWVKITPQGTNAVVNSASFAAQLPEWQAIAPASVWNTASDQVLLTQGMPGCVPWGLVNPPTWYCRPGGYTGSWLDSASVYSSMFLGLRFDSAGSTYYGWARLSIPSNGTSFTLKDYAYYGLPDAGIYAGETQCAIPFGLSVNNVDSNTVTLTWQSSTTDTFNLRYRPTGAATWSVIDSITATTFTLAGLAGCTEYEFQVEGICDGLLTGYSASFIRTTLGCGACIDLTYCPSRGMMVIDEWIARVAVGTLDNQSGANDGYGDFTALGTTLMIGQGHPITLAPGYSDLAYPEFFKVFVDFDQNGNFNGPGELAYTSGGMVGGPISGTLTIPASALAGSTRMRVIMLYDDPTAVGCTNDYDYGETEDYCVALVNNTTGVGESPTSGQLHVFPNPFTSILTVSMGMKTAGVVICTVRALTGQALITRTVAPSSGPSSITLDLGSLAPGTYLLEMQTGGERIVRKVMKE